MHRFRGFKIFHGGVLNLKFVRAFEHRSMAVGLPYVLHGLLNDDLAEQCSLAYLTWRMLLDNELFTEGPVSTGDAVNGMGSVSDLKAAGVELQRLMNQLNQSNNGTGEDIDGDH